jgi:hypothetical protein
MSDFTDLMREDRRLVELRALAATPSYTANNYVLQRGAAATGHRVSHEVIHGDLAWLAEAGLVVAQEAGKATVVTLTARGLDVSSGLSVYPGVKRPLPGD